MINNMDTAEQGVRVAAVEAPASVEPDVSRETEEQEKGTSAKRKRTSPGRSSQKRVAVDRLPRNKSSMILRIASQMFRQHSDIFLQQAAALERIASDPSDPSSWNLEEPSPESQQDRLYNENVVSLAVKSYESMLEVQKRVDYMEQLMIRNGVGKQQIVQSRKKSSDGKKKEMLEPFFFFQREHAKCVANDLGVPMTSEAVKKELKKLWTSMNPRMRQRYKTIANDTEQANKKRIEMKESSEKGFDSPKRNVQTSDGIDESSKYKSMPLDNGGDESGVDMSESGDEILFQKEAGTTSRETTKDGCNGSRNGDDSSSDSDSRNNSGKSD